VAIEVLEPLPERLAVAFNALRGDRPEPFGGMRDRVVAAEMEQPAVATVSLDPRLERAPRIVGRVGPADENVREAALGEEPRRVLDDLPRDGVARQAAVAVCIAGLR
jgi:hypothetical protein